MVLKLEGDELDVWNAEAGGHRIQRVPPTEKRGRVHTSTVTVAVLPHNPQETFEIREEDLRIEWYSGTGKGGQNRNKVQACCRLRHVPTGCVVSVQSRSRTNSFNSAFAELKKRLTEEHTSSIRDKESTMRKLQVGSGQRGDKIRTIQFQNNVAHDHRTGKRITAEQYLKGNMNLLW